jgi:hypothetical protein
MDKQFRGWDLEVDRGDDDSWRIVAIRMVRGAKFRIVATAGTRSKATNRLKEGIRQWRREHPDMRDAEPDRGPDRWPDLDNAPRSGGCSTVTISAQLSSAARAIHADSLRMLGIADDHVITADVVSRARRRMARMAHPDAGGSDERMAMLNSAHDRIMREFSRR